MGDKRDINFQSTERQKRILPEDSFGDWKWREALAELMVPLIGSLYRKGINIMIYGKSLVNESPVAIMKAHRFARQTDNNELSELETYPILQHISTLELQDCEIDSSTQLLSDVLFLMILKTILQRFLIISIQSSNQ